MMTVVCHINDLKVLHKDPFEVTIFYQYSPTMHGNKLRVRREKIHDYLVIYFYYSETGVVKLLMIKYLKKVIDKFPEELRGATSTPVTDRLFQVRGEDEA